MARRLSPEERRELLGAYVLDAVDHDEREQVEELLLDDQEARAEFHALQLGAAWLALGERRPGDHVWERIARGMHGDDDNQLRAPVVQLHPRPRMARRLVTIGAVAAAIALFAVVAVGGFGSSSPRATVAQAAEAASRNPAAQKVALRSPDGQVAGDVVVLPDGRGYLTDASLPTLRASKTYQLWVITAKGPVSAALLGRDPGVVAFRVGSGASSGTWRFAVTPEPTGGSRAPTGAVVAAGDFTLA